MTQRLSYRFKHRIAALGATLSIGCSQDHRPASQISVDPSILPMATIQDLMDSEIDPGADFIWASVGTVVTAGGTEHRQPRTDDEWRELRRKVIILLEATNLLVVPGRHVATDAFPSAGPGVLSSAEIERRLTDDRAGFDAFSLSLRAVALRELVAVDHRDADALSEAGESLDEVCEACHVAYWYPREVIPTLPDFH